MNLQARLDSLSAARLAEQSRLRRTLLPCLATLILFVGLALATCAIHEKPAAGAAILASAPLGAIVTGDQSNRPDQSNQPDPAAPTASSEPTLLNRLAAKFLGSPASPAATAPSAAIAPPSTAAHEAAATSDDSATKIAALAKECADLRTQLTTVNQALEAGKLIVAEAQRLETALATAQAEIASLKASATTVSQQAATIAAAANVPKVDLPASAASTDGLPKADTEGLTGRDRLAAHFRAAYAA